MAEVLAPSTAAGNSADQVVAAGATLSCVLKPATGAAPLSQLAACVLIQVKSSGGDYLTFGALTPDQPVKVLTGAGTYRFTKPASAVAYGVDAS